LCLLQINISNKRKKGPSVILNTHPPQKKKKKKEKTRKKEEEEERRRRRKNPAIFNSNGIEFLIIELMQ